MAAITITTSLPCGECVLTTFPNSGLCRFRGKTFYSRYNRTPIGPKRWLPRGHIGYHVSRASNKKEDSPSFWVIDQKRQG